MPVSLTQTPTTPNGTYTNLVYVASSTSSIEPQYQYVMDVYESGSATLLTRIKQYPNPYNVAVFDPSRILNDYLEYPTAFDLGLYTETTNTQRKEFTLQFGEEYAPSESGSVTLYPNQTSHDIDVMPIVIDPNNGESYNWLDSGSAKLMTDRPNGVSIVGDQDYFYFTAYNGTNTTQPVIISALDEDGNVTDTLGLNVAADKTATINVGVTTTGGGFGFTIDKGLKIEYAGETLTLPYDQNNCHWERVNFGFINNYGFWDFYSVSLPQSKNTSINRREITTPFVNYSSITSPYDSTRRGKDLYNTSLTDNLSISTQWLTEEEAEWLTQMLESPEVYVQVGTKMLPIVITNTSYSHNTNRRAQKKFQYEIQYRFANQRRGR